MASWRARIPCLKAPANAAALAVALLAFGFGAGGAPPSDPLADTPPTLTLSGVLRDFHPRNSPGGHPDMELEPPRGFGLYASIVQDTLDADLKPVFLSTGHKVTTQSVDSQGRPIITPRPYIQSRREDRPAVRESIAGRVVTSSQGFSQWFRDTGGINTSRVISVVLERQPGSDTYRFDGSLVRGTPPGSGRYAVTSKHGPGDPELPNHLVSNFDITWECNAAFIYRRGRAQSFTFSSDDDLWVFIDGRLVIDLGGIHGQIWQSIELDRLAWLQEGHDYRVSIFYAERHRAESHLHIETGVPLKPLPLPPTSPLAD